MSKNVGMHPGASTFDQQSGTSGIRHIAPNRTFTASADAPGCNPTAININANTHRYPQRKNIRAEFHDYSGGCYFVTICTRDKEHYFGKIIKDEMHLSNIGEFANQALKTLHTHYSYVEVPLFVVMPNHVHAIIEIRERADAPGCIPTVRTALSVVVGGYKQSVTMFARRNSIEFGWQSRFHDHIIRGERDENMIAEYIENNVARWANDCFYK